jgi:hypothetical protein
MAGTLDSLSPAARAAMPEIDWAGWRAFALVLREDAPSRDAAAWFAARSLVPATLSWLRVYRRAEPRLFEFNLAPEAPGAPGPDG